MLRDVLELDRRGAARVVVGHGSRAPPLLLRATLPEQPGAVTPCRRRRGSGPAAATLPGVDERLHLADEPLQGLDVVGRRHLDDRRREPRRDVGAEALGDERRRSEERAVRLGFGIRRRRVVRHRGTPDRGGLGRGVPDHHPEVARPLDLGLVAPDVGAVRAEDPVELGEIVRRAEAVPHVGVAGDRAQRLRPSIAADHDREVALERERRVAQLAERVPGPRSRRDGPAVQQRSAGRDRLLEPVEPLPEPGAELDPVRRVLLVHPGPAEAEDRPAAARHGRAWRPASPRGRDCGTCWRRPGGPGGPARWPSPRRGAGPSPRRSAGPGRR